MAWIRTFDEAEATGALRQVYDEAIRRAGRVYNILKVQSMNARTLRESMGLYQATTLAESPVPRAVREMIAVVVSRVNECHY